MPSPTSKGKSNLAVKGKLAIIGVICLMIVIYGTTFVMQVQACDQAISAIHSSYEKKLQFLRDSFTKYKQEHAVAGNRRRKRKANLEDVVADMQEENQAEMVKGNITKGQFQTLFLEEVFRRFDTIPWDSQDFSADDRKEILELWETVKPANDAEFDKPLPRQKYHQLQRILQQFYVRITRKGYSQMRYNVNAPKFFLNRASNEIALLQIKPQINKLHHEWIQAGQANTPETLRIMTKLISDRGLDSALGSFISNLHLLIRDSNDLDYYYEYNYYNDEYLLQLNAEVQEAKRLELEASQVKAKSGGSTAMGSHEAALENKRAQLAQSANSAASQQAVDAKRAYERQKAAQAAAADAGNVPPSVAGSENGRKQQKYVPQAPVGGTGSKKPPNKPPGMPSSPQGARLRGPTKQFPGAGGK